MTLGNFLTIVTTTIVVVTTIVFIAIRDIQLLIPFIASLLFVVFTVKVCLKLKEARRIYKSKNKVKVKKILIDIYIVLVIAIVASGFIYALYILPISKMKFINSILEYLISIVVLSIIYSLIFSALIFFSNALDKRITRK